MLHHMIYSYVAISTERPLFSKMGFIYVSKAWSTCTN